METASFPAHTKKMAQITALVEAIFLDLAPPLSRLNIKLLKLNRYKNGNIEGFCQEQTTKLIFKFFLDDNGIAYEAYFNNIKDSFLTNQKLLLRAWKESSYAYNDRCKCQRTDSLPTNKRTCQKLPCGDSCISTQYTCRLNGSNQPNKKSVTRLKALNHIAKQVQQKGERTSTNKSTNLPSLTPQSRVILQEIAKNNISLKAIALSSGVPKAKVAKTLNLFANGVSSVELASQLQVPEEKVAQILGGVSQVLPKNDPDLAVEKALQENSFDNPHQKGRDEDENEDEDVDEDEDEDVDEDEDEDKDEDNKKRKDSSGDSIPCGNSFISAKYTCRQKQTKIRSSPVAKKAMRKGRLRYLNTKKVSKLPIFQQYENNLKKTGKILRNNPETIEDMKLGKYAEKPRKTNKEQLTFFLAGLSDEESEVENGYRTLEKQFDREGFSRKTELFSMTQEESNRGKSKATLSVVGGNLSKGKNPDSEKIAKHILEWKKKNPHAKLNLVGHSGGGLTGKDVAYILSEAGVDKKDVKTMTLGTPYLDIYPPKNAIKNIVNKDDLFNRVPVRNERLQEIKDRPNVEKNIQNDSRSHSLTSYVSPRFKTGDDRYIKNPAYKKVTDEMRNFFEFD